MDFDIIFREFDGTRSETRMNWPDSRSCAVRWTAVSMPERFTETKVR